MVLYYISWSFACLPQEMKAELADLDGADSAAILREAGFGLAELGHQVNLEILDGPEVSASETVEHPVATAAGAETPKTHGDLNNLGWDFAHEFGTPSGGAPTTLDLNTSDSDIEIVEMVVHPKRTGSKPTCSCEALGGKIGLGYFIAKML